MNAGYAKDWKEEAEKLKDRAGAAESREAELQGFILNVDAALAALNVTLDELHFDPPAGAVSHKLDGGIDYADAMAGAAETVRMIRESIARRAAEF